MGKIILKKSSYRLAAVRFYIFRREISLAVQEEQTSDARMAKSVIISSLLKGIVSDVRVDYK
jgi:hypothetical protein